MIRALAFAAALTVAAPAMAATDSDAADIPGDGQLTGFWSQVFPLAGESYGMFADPYGSPHDGKVIEAAHREAEGQTQTASTPDTADSASDDQVAAAHEVDPLVEGPDLRDASHE